MENTPEGKTVSYWELVSDFQKNSYICIHKLQLFERQINRAKAEVDDAQKVSKDAKTTKPSMSNDKNLNAAAAESKANTGVEVLISSKPKPKRGRSASRSPSKPIKKEKSEKKYVSS